MKIAIRHELSFRPGDGLGRAVQHLLLTPSSGPTQTVAGWTIEMPGIDKAAQFRDAYGNVAHLVTQTKPEGEIAVTVTGTVDTLPGTGVVGRLAGDPVPALFRRQTPLTKAQASLYARFRNAEKIGPGRIALLHGLMDRIGDHFHFGALEPAPAQTQSLGGMTQSQTLAPSGDALDAKGFTHLFIGAARALDIPTRYVTGYWLGDDEHAAGEHAWAEAWDDALGWIAFDAALKVCPTDQHIRLASGLDASSAIAIRSSPSAEVKTVSISVVAE